MRYIFITLLLFANHLFGQNVRWTAIAHCSGDIRITNALASNNGYIFVLGKQSGEVFFQNEKGTKNNRNFNKRNSIHKYGENYFIACYTSKGKVKFVYPLTGVTRDFSIRSACAYKNNSILFFTDDNTKIALYNKKTKKTSFTESGNVFCVSSKGEILWVKELRYQWAKELCADNSGRIFMTSQDKYDERKNELICLDSSFNIICKINLKGIGIAKPICINDTIYALIFNGIDNQEAIIPFRHFGLCKFDFTTQKFSIIRTWKLPYPLEQKNSLSYSYNIDYYKDTLSINLFFNTNTKCCFLNDTLQNEKQFNRVYKLNEFGDVKKSEEFNSGNYYCSVFASNDGFVYLTLNVKDSLRTTNNLQIKADDYSSQLVELVYAKLNQNLEFEWMIKGGGISTSYHHSLMVESPKGELYGISDLAEHFNCNNKIYKLRSHSGFYITRIK